MLKIYDSLTRKKRVFQPLNDKLVKMYVCGITCYDYCHLGHGRTFITFDMIARYLKYLNFKIDYVQNITDIDDKIIQCSRRRRRCIYELVNYFIKATETDWQGLDLFNTKIVRVTATILEIIALIESLRDKGYAYLGRKGNVYFDIAKFANYGALANRSLENLASSEQIETATDKKNPLDFVLWKAVKPNEPWWHSPFGRGRPGWHIECAAIILKHLGKQIDIHGGGLDLIFPHHENEITIVESLTAKKFANFWMHAGLLQSKNKKISKSDPLFQPLHQILKEYSHQTIRYFFYTTHYRNPQKFRESGLKQARIAMTRLASPFKYFQPKRRIENYRGDYKQRFLEAMNDDFNTPEALAILSSLRKEINKYRIKDRATAENLAAQLFEFCEILNIPPIKRKTNEKNISIIWIEEMINQRKTARINKDYELADEIRADLKKNGIIIEDEDYKTSWYVAEK